MLITPDEIYSAFESLSSTMIIGSTVRYAVATIASCFLIINFINIYRDTTNTGKFNFSEIIKQIVYIIVIFNYDAFFWSIEAIAKSIGLMITELDSDKASYNDAIANCLIDGFKNFELFSITSLTLTPILYIILGLAWIINNIVIMTFYIDRGFFLFLFNLLAPFVIALSVKDSHKDTENKDLNRILRFYFVIIICGYVYELVDYCMDYLFVYMSKSIEGGFTVVDSRVSKLIVIAAICIFSKIRIFNATKEFLNKLFGV